MFWTIKLCNYAKLHCLNRTVYLYKIDLILNNLQTFIWYKTQTNKHIIPIKTCLSNKIYANINSYLNIRKTGSRSFKFKWSIVKHLKSYVYRVIIY